MVTVQEESVATGLEQQVVYSLIDCLVKFKFYFPFRRLCWCVLWTENLLRPWAGGSRALRSRPTRPWWSPSRAGSTPSTSPGSGPTTSATTPATQRMLSGHTSQYILHIIYISKILILENCAKMNVKNFLSPSLPPFGSTLFRFVFIPSKPVLPSDASLKWDSLFYLFEEYKKDLLLLICFRTD